MSDGAAPGVPIMRQKRVRFACATRSALGRHRGSLIAVVTIAEDILKPCPSRDQTETAAGWQAPSAIRRLLRIGQAVDRGARGVAMLVLDVRQDAADGGG